MADSNITLYENSVQNGRPVECYQFTHAGMNYQYTSANQDVSIIFTENGLQRTEKYFADYIERETIKPASSSDSVSVTIKVSKDNAVAKLYQGPPPEKPVYCKIYRLHAQDLSNFDVAFYGRVSQASFEASECSLTVKLEDWLSKEIPNGARQFTCNSMIFDSKCRLKEEDWVVAAFVDRVVGLDVYSTTFAQYPDGYFTGGFLRFDGGIRQIAEHVDDRVKVKYPFLSTPRNEIVVAPGCDHLFKTCATRFRNTLNFTGCLYVPPANPEKTNVGKGAYWVDSQVVQRDTNGFVGNIEM
ncbi:Hypothetical protein LUCI_0771 [Lucifera butyrica]|uniref:Bacteriophage phiJL001 Gp84 C-terminal domain-containing protein n=1 Tax=Lucifera butyrica TaxID=1351585 RepID=A0A498R2E1_9FIRM|nr:phage BR0599 family protein [Lucifera butyrica]VBB05561.1 Hypothetical protein LUCI_0771 [Lucifera butyrica]